MISTIEGRCNRCEKKSANSSVFGWMTRNLPTPDTKAIARENRERMFPDYLCNHCQKLARWRTYFSQNCAMPSGNNERRQQKAVAIDLCGKYFERSGKR